jgi:probable HAF family extracellular repeat protein
MPKVRREHIHQTYYYSLGNDQAAERLQQKSRAVRHNASDVGVSHGSNGKATSHLLGGEEHLSMRISISAVYAAIALAATAALSGCGGGASSSSFAPSASTQQRITQSGSNVRSRGVSQYYLVTLDSLGGSVSFAININSEGQASGASLLSGNTIEHAQIWERLPHTIDLGTLGGPNSGIFQYNHGRAGQFVGWSETSSIDPNDENFCGFGTSHICLGFSWQNGRMRPLPTLGGNNDNTNDVNKRGQMVGAAETNNQDPSCTPPHVLDYLGVIWQPDGKITTLPPYPGDTVSYAYTMTQSGQDAVGNSGSCATPTAHAVLWQNASSPINLGSLGGSVNIALDINNRGQIIGNSDLSGNMVTHAFLWQRGTMNDLGALPGDVDSFAGGINDEGQVVGESCDASGNCRGFVWQNGSMTDLNTLIPLSKNLNVLFGSNINDRGEITGATVNEQGLEQAVVLLPRGRADVLSNGVSAPKVTLPESLRTRLRNQSARFWDLRKKSVILR